MLLMQQKYLTDIHALTESFNKLSNKIQYHCAVPCYINLRARGPHRRVLYLPIPGLFY